MSTILRSVVVLVFAVLWSGSGLALPRFSDMVVIGDSLSDQGNVFRLTSSPGFPLLIPPLEYTDGTNFGRFTTRMAVPVPAALWLFGSGIIGLLSLACRRAAQA